MALQVLACGLHELGLEEPAASAAMPAPPAMAAESYGLTGDRDVLSLTTSVDPIDAQVQLALVAVRDSGAAGKGTGQRFSTIKKLGDDIVAVLDGETRTALTRLVKNGDISVVSIVVETGSDWAEIVVTYINHRLPGGADKRQARSPRF